MSADLRHEMADAFDAVLGDMRQAASRLTAALAAERDALERADADALHLAGQDKQAQLDRLEQLDAERQQLARAVAATTPAQRAAWEGVMSTLADCRHANQSNGQIVGQRLRQVRQALAVLTGGAESGVYGPGGTLRIDHRSLSLAEA
ncbi:flagellar protein FlgN [Dyella marensis]|jgi:flagella synthesis protein FlgN|uniref:Flagella synthesis protein FlgN n=1 Tax=Dyella marensis TaxID=500610 RepID=A0A1I2HZJ6_9GAMM|nr:MULTISPECIES: flagellar protein FlgN [Dyella]SFF35392.1 flagella synthesis protein FlgN [Dyella marensis]